MKHQPSFSLLENSTLALATLVFGIMAGFFWAYSFNVNYALLQLDGKTYAVVQSLLNENVRHLMFFSFFFGGGAFSVLAIAVNFKHRKELTFWLIVAASLCYIFGIIFFTREVNLPLNYYTESWQPSNLPSDWEETRKSWNSANLFRVFTSFISFLLCIVALILRATNKKKSA